MIQSLLDTDLYKLTMQQAVREHYPDGLVSYRFTNRGGTKFSRAMFKAVQSSIARLADLTLTKPEHDWLERKCPYFKPEYLNYLDRFRFRPDEQVQLHFVPDRPGSSQGRFDIEIKGLWVETILYEVPLMSIISEAYFTQDDKAWDYSGQFDLAKDKGRQLFEAGCLLSEFGTRRRRTYLAHDIIIRGLLDANEQYGQTEGKGKLVGTSNVHLAQKYDLNPIGTIAHEWVMGVAATTGYEGSNGRAMDLWDQTYPSGALSIALTDTFSTKPFFDDFISNPARGQKWRGLRQDSGDPFAFIDVAKRAFEGVGADPKTKMVVFSDGLDVARCIALKAASDKAGIGCSFGVGTTLTNDFMRIKPEDRVSQAVPGEGDIRREGEPSKALNMVIKLYKINSEFCVKISDELTKNTGDPETVRMVKERFGLEHDPIES